MIVRQDLGRTDLSWAMDVGIRRYRGLPRGADHEGRDLGQRLLDQVNGAAGELAVALTLGIPWPALVDTFSQVPDFPDQGIEVKTTSTHGGLAIRPREALHLAEHYVLVHGLVTPMVVVGWLPGELVKAELDKDLRQLAGDKAHPLASAAAHQ